MLALKLFFKQQDPIFSACYFVIWLYDQKIMKLADTLIFAVTQIFFLIFDIFILN